MGEMVEGGASLAWRLLATLEGGSLLLATSALLAYSARKKVARLKRTRRPVRSVLLTNSTNELGKELKTQLELRGCYVHTASDEIVRRVSSDASAAISASYPSDNISETKVDALVVVGAFSQPKLGGLQGMAKLVSEDVYHNLKLLEGLSALVSRGGCVAWACAGAAASTSGAEDAFDTVLRANLHHVAKTARCEAVWVGRCDSAAAAAERVTDALLFSGDATLASRFSIRNAANKAGEYVGRWLKIAA
ncbi:uncharacterized protein LOC114366199 isoform X3 [Ostrinia furnacalis]|uniref:uncharacterized protein LOC114366199 isoform X3 n=1 Tax=Ostrinia furnacalis TaxID=93504 RepID=UPI001038B2F1|nr:uncharacterized protein LOC114366199 isoform X3 [Ostrinia furnacalis]